MERQKNIKDIFKHRYPFKLKEEWEVVYIMGFLDHPKLPHLPSFFLLKSTLGPLFKSS